MAKATGGSVTTDGLYTIHTFLTTADFVALEEITAEVLIVAGGAGAGKGGGGGGGGIYYDATMVIAADTHSAVVGAGGAILVNGVNSTFNSQTAVGGGTGGDGNEDGEDGACGGGGGMNTSTGTVFYGGTGSVGGDGGDTPGIGNAPCGGGGGLGGDGETASDIVGGGDGGVGIDTYSALIHSVSLGVLDSGTYFICGGGGGGVWASYSLGVGKHGGGDGGVASLLEWGEDGTVNTGGGGGGAGDNRSGEGGSGFIIIRYLTTSTLITYPIHTDGNALFPFG